jgi:hypothetical protein
MRAYARDVTMMDLDAFEIKTNRELKDLRRELKDLREFEARLENLMERLSLLLELQLAALKDGRLKITRDG